MYILIFVEGEGLLNIYLENCEGQM